MIILEYILFAAVIYNLVMAIIILLRVRDQASGLIFTGYILATVAWTASVALMPIYPHKPEVLYLLRSAHCSAALIVISLVWFCTTFPHYSAKFARVSWLLTILGLPWLVLAWGRWLIPDVKISSWGVDAVSGQLMPFFTSWAIISAIIAITHLALKGQKSRGLERLQVRYILLGAVGLIVVGAVPNLVLPSTTGSFRLAPLGPLSSLIITSTTTYAIVRYRLMDIKIVLRAGLVYSVTIGTLSLLFALLVPLLNRTLTNHYDFPDGAGSFIMAFLIALAFQPFRTYVQNQVDRRFFKSVYDYRLTLREAGSAFASARDQQILINTMINALIRTLRPFGAAFYIPGHQNSLVLSSTAGTWTSLPEIIHDEHPLLQYAMETDEVLLADELIRQPEPHQTNGLRMRAWGAHVALPLIAGEQLCGMVLLGEKLSGDVYTADDIGLLRILGKQAAIALDNARHFHDMVMLNEYHARLLHIMHDGVIALDPQQRIITFNPASEYITGVPVNEAIGNRLDHIGLAQLPTTITREQGREVEIIMRDGREVPLLVTVTPFTRLYDVSDCYLIVFRDLSTLRALEAEKVQAERFSSMGAMAASLAHEIKNPLVPIKLFAHLLPVKYDDHEFREEFSHTVVKEVERINRLVGQMLDLVRSPLSDRCPVDLREILERLLSLLQGDCARNAIHVTTEISATLPPVMGMAEQLYQALLNVLTNAVQVMPTGGELSVIVEVQQGKIVCCVSDTGPGVPQSELARIFEPLYTTKTGGHGLGLALTYQFIRTHGGEIRADCVPGEGLTVTISLPAMTPGEIETLCSSSAI